MPRFTKQSESQTLDLHAPWWGDATEPAPTPVTTRTGHKTADGEWEWIEATSAQRHVERVTVRRTMTERDQQLITEQLFAKFRPVKGGGVDPKRMAKTRVYTFLRAIVEMTDETGHPVVLSEALLADMRKADADFLNAALDDLNEPAVPVLPQDEEMAWKMSEDEHFQDDVEATSPEGQAKRSFRAARQVVPIR